MRSLRSTLSVIVSSVLASSFRQLVAELGPHQILDFLAGAHHDWERIAAAEWLARVDEDAGIARIFFAVGHRVERRRPAAAQNLHALARIAARAHCPDHLVHVGGIDVVIDHHDKAVDVSAGVTLRGNQSGLLGMTGVLLLDRHREPEPAAARPGATPGSRPPRATTRL